MWQCGECVPCTTSIVSPCATHHDVHHAPAGTTAWGLPLWSFPVVRMTSSWGVAGPLRVAGRPGRMTWTWPDHHGHGGCDGVMRGRSEMKCDWGEGLFGCARLAGRPLQTNKQVNKQTNNYRLIHLYYTKCWLTHGSLSLTSASPPYIPHHAGATPTTTPPSCPTWLVPAPPRTAPQAPAAPSCSAPLWPWPAAYLRRQRPPWSSGLLPAGRSGRCCSS